MNNLLTEIKLVETITEEGEDIFCADDRTQYAIIMAYARMGEIAERLPEEPLATHPEVERRPSKDSVAC